MVEVRLCDPCARVRRARVSHGGHVSNSLQMGATFPQMGAADLRSHPDGFKILFRWGLCMVSQVG